MRILTKRTIFALLLCFAFIGVAFILFSNSSITAIAHEQNEIHEHGNSEGGLESLSEKR